MKIRWCWRCQDEMPMLDKEEFGLCRQAMKEGRGLVESEIEKRKIKSYEWMGKLPSSYERFRYFIEMYHVITGYKEMHPNAIWHHTIDQFGADCPGCKKPLRTELARYCVECGFGKEDFTSQDTLPLVERRPGLFE